LPSITRSSLIVSAYFNITLSIFIIQKSRGCRAQDAGRGRKGEAKVNLSQKAKVKSQKYKSKLKSDWVGKADRGFNKVGPAPREGDCEVQTLDETGRGF
jgi:hypothetical protein